MRLKKKVQHKALIVDLKSRSQHLWEAILRVIQSHLLQPGLTPINMLFGRAIHLTIWFSSYFQDQFFIYVKGCALIADTHDSILMTT